MHSARISRMSKDERDNGLAVLTHRGKMAWELPHAISGAQLKQVTKPQNTPSISFLKFLKKFEVRGTRQTAAVVSAWKPVLFWWRILGIVPLQTQRNNPWVFFSWKSFVTVRTGMLTLLFLFMLIISLLLFKDSMDKPARDVATASFNVLYYGYCVFTCTFFLRRGSRIAQTFTNWQATEDFLAKYNLRVGLVRKCWILLGIMGFISTLDNVLYLWSKVVKGTGSDVVEVLESLAEKGTKPYLGKFSYLYGGLLFVTESWGSFTWVVGDSWIMLSSVILHHYYTGFNDYVKKQRSLYIDVKEIEEWRKSHFLISEMVDELDRTMAPLTLCCFATNVVYTLATLYTGIVEELNSEEVVVRASFVVVFAFLLLRIIGSSHLAAKIPEEASRSCEMLLQLSTFGLHMERNGESTERLIILDRFMSQINGRPCGLGAFGFFVLSKSFMATLFSAIITYEVIILQLPRN